MVELGRIALFAKSTAFVLQSIQDCIRSTQERNLLPDHSLIERNSLDFIILTHCHLDHLGSLPLLSREHPEAPVFLSYGSSVISHRMLSNSISVMRRQRSELNLPELPLYGRGDLSSLYSRMKTLSTDAPLTLEKDGRSIEVTLHHAGHVAGAVSVTSDPKRNAFSSGTFSLTTNALSGAPSAF